jgi:peroxiredoxin
MSDAAPDCELVDDAGKPRRISEFWAQKPLVLFFVRHLGCPLCRSQAAEIKKNVDRFTEAGAEIAMVTMGTGDDAAEFRRRMELPFTVLADADQECYRAFSVPRGGVLSVIGPHLLPSGLMATLKFGAAKSETDPWQLPGAFVIDTKGEIRFAHRAKHSADWPKNDDLVGAIQAACERES